MPLFYILDVKHQPLLKMQAYFLNKVFSFKLLFPWGFSSGNVTLDTPLYFL